MRINKPFELAVLDLDAAIWPGLSGIVFPKVESAVEVQIIDRLIAEREMARGLPVGQIELSMLVESALGVQHMAEIACASPRSRRAEPGRRGFHARHRRGATPDGAEQEYGKGMVDRRGAAGRHPAAGPEQHAGQLHRSGGAGALGDAAPHDRASRAQAASTPPRCRS